MTPRRFAVVCLLALVSCSVVESCHLHKNKCRKTCPDTLIDGYFGSISATIYSDFDYINNLINIIGCKQGSPEYPAIIELWTELQGIRQSFDTSFDTCQDDIISRLCGYRKKYSDLSICYTERVVVLKKLARRQLRPDLCKFRLCFDRLLPKIEVFIKQYGIDCKPRVIVCPKPCDYNLGVYFPSSRYTSEVGLVHSTCHKDLLYLLELLEKLNWPAGCDIRDRCKNRLLEAWIAFSQQARCLDIDYYPRIIDCNDDISQIDVIVLEYLKKLKCASFKFGEIFVDCWGDIDRLCTENKLPWIPFVDFDVSGALCNQRGLYLLSPKLNKYISGIYATLRSDFLTENRLWKLLECQQGSREWKIREEKLCLLKERLSKCERWLNRYLYKIMQRLRDLNIGWDCDLDRDYETIIIEIITDCDKEIYPYLIEFRECFYDSDSALDSIIGARGGLVPEDISRNIISCSSPGYDISTYIPLSCDLRDLIEWIENCLRTNYYPSITDLIQIKFDSEDCEEFRLRKKCLVDLECLWKDYRSIIKELLREIIGVCRKENCAIGSDIYIREFERLRGCFRPRLCGVVDKFKNSCKNIDGILDIIYKKNTNCGTCKRNYKFVEASFNLSVKVNLC